MNKIQKEELISTIVEFLIKEDDFLCEYVEEDLKIEIDHKCSSLYDEIHEKKINKSFEDVVLATRDRIIVAIESFIE